MMLSLVLSIVAIALAYWTHTRHQRSKCLPPGPPRDFLLGNARQLRTTLAHSWPYYVELAKRYGDVVSLDVFGQTIVILSSFEAINDLVVSKSAIFSGRPTFVMAGELVGFDHTPVLTNPGPRFRMFRKLMNQFMGAQAMPRHHSAIEAEIRGFIQRTFTADGTADFFKAFKFTLGRIVLDLAYGIKVDSPESPYVVSSRQVVKIFVAASQPGRFLVDTFPILKHVPSWFPLATFKLQAAEWRKILNRQSNQPLQQVKSELLKGVAKPSFASEMLENPPPGATEDIIRQTCSALYSGAVETATAAIGVFVLAMVLHPEVQKEAQAELERVIGNDRLPTLSDRRDLPYLEAVLKEVMRWHPIAPITPPYRTLEECQYRGWIIPKDSIIIANCLSLSRDQALYRHPEEFNPRRFVVDPSLPDPRQFYYGFGRRVCPGRHLADAILWTAIATHLATSTISREVDENGAEIIPKAEFAGDSVWGPLPFPFRVEPRSQTAAAIIQDAVPRDSMKT